MSRNGTRKYNDLPSGSCLVCLGDFQGKDSSAQTSTVNDHRSDPVLRWLGRRRTRRLRLTHTPSVRGTPVRLEDPAPGLLARKGGGGVVGTGVGKIWSRKPPLVVVVTTPHTPFAPLSVCSRTDEVSLGPGPLSVRSGSPEVPSLPFPRFPVVRPCRRSPDRRLLGLFVRLTWPRRGV